MIRRGMGVLLAFVLTVSIAAASRVPWAAAAGDDGRLRLSWRLRGEEVESCRRLTDEELDELPVHMRNPEACEGRVTPYRLTVRVDGEPRVRRSVRPAGARGDRPVFVLEELTLPPGTHRIEISFEPTDSAATGPPLLLDESLRIAPRDVALITIDGDAGRLVVRE